MALNMAELVTVVEHDCEGRILRFVKTLIPLGDAEELKAAAALDNKRKRDKAVLRDTEALLASAKALRLAAPRRVDDDKPAEEVPPALPAVKSLPQPTLPAPLSGVSPQRSATRTAMPKRTMDDFIDEASVVLSVDEGARRARRRSNRQERDGQMAGAA